MPTLVIKISSKGIVGQILYENGGISYNELSKKVKKTINIIPKTSNLNFMKYAYVNKEFLKIYSETI